MQYDLLLRSVYKGQGSDNADLLLKNFYALRQSGAYFFSEERTSVWEFICEFVVQHGHVPLYSTIRDAFEDVERVRDEVNLMTSKSPVYRGDFQKLIASALDNQNREKTKEIFNNAQQINLQELTLKDDDGKKRTYKGPMDAWRYTQSRMLEVTAPNSSGVLKEGEVTEDGEAFMTEYERRRDDPNYGLGQATGLDQLDNAFGGARKGQLWTHAAFTGELKSTLSFNWVYNQAIYCGYDSLSFCLEMDYEQCQRIIYVMHSMHPIFKEERLRVGIQEHPDVPEAISYKQVRDGTLPKEHETFLRDFVMEDLKDPARAYGKIHFRGYDPDKPTFTVADIRAKSESLYRESPFQMLVVDHTLLVDAQGRHNSTTERANEVVRDLKRLATTFHQGDGMPVVNLFQISREGKKRADKVAGPHKYNLYDLSYSNEIERSSDIVTTSYLNQGLRDRGLALIQGIKGRDDGVLNPFYASINWSCRRLMNCSIDPVEDMSVEEGVEEFNQMSFDFSKLGS